MLATFHEFVSASTPFMSDIATIKSALSDVKVVNRGTNIPKALQFAKESLFVASRGVRSGTDRFVIFITDGISTQSGEDPNVGKGPP